MKKLTFKRPKSRVNVGRKRRQAAKLGKWGFPGHCCLEMPRLSHSDEFDPEESKEMAVVERRAKYNGEVHHEVHRVPLVRLKFPAYELRDGQASGDVLGLPKTWVQWVLDQKFAVPWEAIPSINFLFNLAREQWGHPLLSRFDTAVRDGLAAIAEEAAFRAFWLLGDYIYDAEKKYFVKYEDKRLWCHLATYLFWATSGQVGSGLPWFFSKLNKEYKERLDDWPKEHKKLIELIHVRSFPRFRKLKKGS